MSCIPDRAMQAWTIKEIIAKRCPKSWEPVFADAGENLDYVSKTLQEQEEQYGSWYPLKSELFSAFEDTPLDQVKVVIIGQDPYPQTIYLNGMALPRAVGKAFSVRKGDQVPSSLKNIYLELQRTVYGFTTPNHGDLTVWAKQGVLLLNTCLTVRPGVIGSHSEVWLGVISYILKHISRVNPRCIFLLWGNVAKGIIPLIGDKCIKLEAPHPSGRNTKSFVGCDHFIKVNKFLIEQDKSLINWNIDYMEYIGRSLPSTTEKSETAAQLTAGTVEQTVAETVDQASDSEDIIYWEY